MQANILVAEAQDQFEIKKNTTDRYLIIVET